MRVLFFRNFMPRRNDIQRILVIGSGPIAIGQACEFDYAGVQACQALREAGYYVVLVNSNPVTIMTDPAYSDRTYIEPLVPEVIETILQKEKIDALLPTLGGQTALNLAMDLFRRDVLVALGVELIGACPKSIEKAESRSAFRKSMDKVGISCLKGFEVTSWEAVQFEFAKEGFSFPLIVRASFTLGGFGGGIAHDFAELEKLVNQGLVASPIHQVLVEESVLGWKEYEMEVMRDQADRCIVVCGIENVDPMGVHTGDSITVAPILTLTDKEYQRMRTDAFAVIREIGVATGGANVQFAVDPKTGRRVVIEMNPRVSRSSALASKATGFPIAKIAALLAVGFLLDEIRNELTQTTYAAFEPSMDYVVTKIPYFDFEKFEGVEAKLHTVMQSVGEVMAIGRTFSESLQKAVCSLEQGYDGLFKAPFQNVSMEVIQQGIQTPNAERLFFIAEGFRRGLSVKNVAELSFWDPWFLRQIEYLIQIESEIQQGAENLDNLDFLRYIKSLGFSDKRLAKLTSGSEYQILFARKKQKINPIFRRVDTCAGEFPSETPYLYSTYLPFSAGLQRLDSDEAQVSNRKKIIILGSGPNRIGQGIEFDYCCVHAAQAVKGLGFEAIMINANPETVSTDHHCSDRLYFSPLFEEPVFEIIQTEQRSGQLLGVFVQFGGQTALKLAQALAEKRIPLLGTSWESISFAEDRSRFQALLKKLNLSQPPNGVATSEVEFRGLIHALGFPVIVRPSYVLGGKGMKVLHSRAEMDQYLLNHLNHLFSDLAPVLVETFLSEAIECDVDALSDGEHVEIVGILEHLESAGVHSGDSACVLPSFSLSPAIKLALINQTRLLAQALKVKGPLNVQFAIQGEKVFIIEVNPRASRTLPFVAKAMKKTYVKQAVRLCLGETLSSEFSHTSDFSLSYYAAKQPIFSFDRFREVNTCLGPVMKSTGEAMGIGLTPVEAVAKAIRALFKKKIDTIAVVWDFGSQERALMDAYRNLGIVLLEQIPSEWLLRAEKQVDLLLLLGKNLVSREAYYRAAHQAKIPVFTTWMHALALVEVIKAMSQSKTNVYALQDRILEPIETVTYEDVAL